MNTRQQLSSYKLLLLGGEGFIGRNIAEYFSGKNICFSVGSEKSLFEKRNDVFLQAKPYEEKINHESNVIVHLIDNKVLVDTFIEQEKKLIKNIGLDKRHHLIVFSSAVIYANPDSDYGRRKQALEKFYTEYCKERGIRLTILRLFNTFGPYQIPYRQGSLVGNLIYNFLTKKKTEINDKEANRDFLYAGDIPKFIEYTLAHQFEGTHDIGSGQLTSIAGLISLLENKILKSALDISYRNIKETVPNRFAESDIVEMVDLVEFEEGMRKTVKFYEDNMSIIQSYAE